MYLPNPFNIGLIITCMDKIRGAFQSLLLLILLLSIGGIGVNAEDRMNSTDQSAGYPLLNQTPAISLPSATSPDSVNIPPSSLAASTDLPSIDLPTGVAPINPAYLRYLNEHQRAVQQKGPMAQISGSALTEGLQPTPYATGGIPPIIDQSYLTGPFVREVSPPSSGSPAARLAEGGTPPVDLYDLRTLGKVTPVKNQGTSGTCWAFASMASLESSLLTSETWDFSENNMKNLLSSGYPEGYDRGANDGGNNWKAAAYLTRWSGPVTEADDPFDPTSVTSPTDKPVPKHAQNMYLLPDRTGPTDNANIKTALETYGAVSTFMYMNQYPPNLNTKNSTYYYSGSTDGNHVVAIVGWNGTFERDRFAPNIPPGDGAFIVKNSWGTAWGENGYFYISYYDTQVGKYSAVFTAEPRRLEDQIYQYDPLGRVTDYYYGTEKTGWMANIFTATRYEKLNAVSFYTTDTNTNYEVYVFKNPDNGPVDSRGTGYSEWGETYHFANAGYHTIFISGFPYSRYISLAPGDRFSVVVKVTNPTYEYWDAVEYPDAYFKSTKATANAGESYVSTDGVTWYDLTTDLPNTNNCIKAFTKNPYNIGVFRNGHGWYLDHTWNGVWNAGGDTAYGFGMAGDVPVTGDWNNDGKTEIGVFRGGHGWYLDSSGNGVWNSGEDTAYGFGMAGDVPVTGDWNNDGKTEIGVFRGGHGWYLDSSGNGAWNSGEDTAYGFGMAGDVPVTGDWNNDGKTEIGVFRDGHGWYLDSSGNGVWNSGEDTAYGFGMPGDVPATGDWNNDGKTEIGVFRDGHGWYLDSSGNGVWNAGQDTAYGFGITGDLPVAGKW